MLFREKVSAGAIECRQLAHGWFKSISNMPMMEALKKVRER